MMKSKSNYLNRIEAQHLPIETCRLHKLLDIDHDGDNNNDGGNDEFKSILFLFNLHEPFK